jgi:hypothetical protein
MTHIDDAGPRVAGDIGTGNENTGEQLLLVQLVFQHPRAAWRAAGLLQAFGYATVVAEQPAVWLVRWFSRTEWMVTGSCLVSDNTLLGSFHQSLLEKIAHRCGGAFDGCDIGRVFPADRHGSR